MSCPVSKDPCWRLYLYRYRQVPRRGGNRYRQAHLRGIIAPVGVHVCIQPDPLWAARAFQLKLIALHHWQIRGAAAIRGHGKNTPRGVDAVHRTGRPLVGSIAIGQRGAIITIHARCPCTPRKDTQDEHILPAGGVCGRLCQRNNCSCSYQDGDTIEVSSQPYPTVGRLNVSFVVHSTHSPGGIQTSTVARPV